MRPALVRASAVLLAACLTGCGDGPSGPPPESVRYLTIGPSPRVVMPSTVELRLEVVVHDSLGEPLPAPPRSAFEWSSSDPSIATISGEGVLRVRGAAPQGAHAVIHVAYGEAESFLDVFAALPPIAAKVVPELTITPGAQLLLFGVAVNPQGLDEEGHMTSFSVLEGASSAHLTRVGCLTEAADCVNTAPDLAWLFADAPGQVRVQAEVDGQVGTGTIVIRTAGFASVTAGGTHTCGVTTDEALFCWGAGYLATPVLIERPGLAQVQAGGERTCGLDAGGLAYCWGRGISLVPEPVSSAVHFARLVVGPESACGLEAGGKAWCWGANGWGQLGDGTKNPAVEPVAVAGGLTFSDIATYGDHACGLTAAGEAWCWGSNTVGELGDTTVTEGCGSYGCSTTPIRAAEAHTFVQIVTGLYFSCGLTAEGAARCWGNSDKIGTPPTGRPGIIEEVADGHVFTSLTAGTDHACGVATDGRAWCWGFNDRGQTGEAPGSFKRTPTLVRYGHTFSALDAGGLHTCGLAEDGLYCWGENGSGQLGVLNPSGSGPVLVTGSQATAGAGR